MIQWTSSTDGTIIGAGGHVHPGGKQVVFENYGSKSNPCPNTGNGYGGTLLIIGDRKGPSSYPLRGVEFYEIDEQRKLPFRLARVLPENHYTRKNLGYLLAFQQRPDCIYETDDELMEICKALAQMAPGDMFAGPETVELDQSAANVIATIDAAMRDSFDG